MKFAVGETGETYPQQNPHGVTPAVGGERLTACTYLYLMRSLGAHVAVLTLPSPSLTATRLGGTVASAIRSSSRAFTHILQHIKHILYKLQIISNSRVFFWF